MTGGELLLMVMVMRVELGLIVFENGCTTGFAAVIEAPADPDCRTVADLEAAHGVTLQIDEAAGVLRVATGGERLPAMVRRERERAWARLGQRDPGAVENVAQPYELIGWPSFYTQHTLEMADGDTGDWSSGYMDLEAAYGTTRLSWSHRSEEGLVDARASWRRDGLTLGDVFVPGDALFDYTRGRGATFRSDERGRSFSTTVEGALPAPGWAAELYVNGALWQFQPANGATEYRFEDVPVIGTTEARVELYGPAGERRTDTRTILAGGERVAPGRVTIEGAVIEPDVNLIDTDASSSSSGPGGDQRRRGYIEGRAGLLPSATARARVDHAAAGDYVTLGALTGLGAVPLEADIVRDPDGALAAVLGMTAGRVRLRHQERQADFIAEEDNGAERVTELQGSAALGLTYLTGSVERATYGDRAARTRADVAVSRGLADIAASARLSRSWTDDGSASSFGTLAATWRDHERRTRITGSVNGSMNEAEDDLPTLNGFTITATHELNEALGIGLDASYAPAERSARLAPSMTFANISGWRLGVRAELTNDHGQALRLTFSTALQTSPEGARVDPDGAGRALVTVHVFVDLDGNGRLSAGDTPLAGVTIPRLGVTKADGRASAWLPAWADVIVHLQAEDLVDPRHFPPTRALALTVRPGRVNSLDVPVEYRSF